MKLGLIGNPLGHSWSPEIHAFFLKEECYTLHEIPEEEVESFFRTTDLDGFNVTIPYKQKVIPLLDEVDPAAQKIGAVNTVVHRDGKFKGYNTDYEGFVEMVRGNGIEVNGKHVAVLGDGGVSKAVTAGIETLGGPYDVVGSLGNPGTITYEELLEKQASYSIIVNATPVGMTPKENAAPVDLDKFEHLEAVVDVIANPLCTKLCFEAKRRGLKHCGGFEMLVRQALAADRYFTGHAMDDTAVKPCMDYLLKDRRSIVLIGMPTSGKSTIAAMIAAKTGRPLIEMDEVIESRLGTTIAECFKEHGEAYFREVEAQLASELTATNAVISCGGGVVKNPENMRSLSMNGLVFWIDRDIDLLFGTSSRPLSQSKEDITRLYEERKGLYQAYADVRVENNGAIEDVVNEILSATGDAA